MLKSIVFVRHVIFGRLRLNALVLSLKNQLNDSLRLKRKQALKIANLEASSRLSKKHRLGSSSQKRILKEEDVTDRDDDKGDSDGLTNCSVTGVTAIIQSITRWQNDVYAP